RSVRVVALHAIHPPFNHRMSLGQAELRMSFQMTLETRAGFFAWVHDKLPAPATRGNVFAARTMTRFAPRLPDHFSIGQMHTRMRAGRKNSADVRVAIVTSLVPDVICSRNFRWREDGARKAGAGDHKDHQPARDDEFFVQQVP